MNKLFLSICIAFCSFNLNATELSFYQNKTVKAFIHLSDLSQSEYYDLIDAKYNGIGGKITKNTISEILNTTKICTERNIIHTSMCEITLKEIEEMVDEAIKEELGK